MSQAAATTDLVTHFGEAAEYTGVRDRRDEEGGIDPAWLDMRRTMVTASEVAAIMGEVPGRSALSVFVDKMTERREPEELGLDDPRLWGSELEQPILRVVARKLGWRYQRGGYLLRSRKYPDLGCTLDAEIDRGDSFGWIPYEGKTTRIPGSWDPETGDLPTTALIQTQSQLIVTQAPINQAFALLQGCRPAAIEIIPSDALHEVIIEHVEWFMDLVRRAEPPPPDGTEASRKALHRLYPVDNGAVVPLPPESVDWTREYQELAKWMTAIERRKAETANLLRAHIGDATHGLLPEEVGGKSCWRWAANQSGSRTLLALKNVPAGLPLLPAPRVPTLADQLEESIANENAKVTPINRKRRRARRR